MTQMVTIHVLFQLWMRQLGHDQYRDGGVGFDAEAATSLMEYAQRIEDTGAGPDASTSVEDAAQSQIGRDTSELQSRGHTVCRHLLEKKKKESKKDQREEQDTDSETEHKTEDTPYDTP